jgi:hypothetical protein
MKDFSRWSRQDLVKRVLLLEDALADMVNQFAYTGRDENVIHTGGLSALEMAFATLKLSDPTSRANLAVFFGEGEDR